MADPTGIGQWRLRHDAISYSALGAYGKLSFKRTRPRIISSIIITSSIISIIRLYGVSVLVLKDCFKNLMDCVFELNWRIKLIAVLNIIALF